MSFCELEGMLNRLVKRPLKQQMYIDFDKQNQIFRLSTVIYQAHTKIPSGLATYIKKFEKMTFRPHKTSYKIKDSNIHLIQELPFQSGFQDTVRSHSIEFWRLAKKCHQMLSEIASE